MLLVSGRFPLSKTIIPEAEAQEHFLTPSPRRDDHPIGGLGLRLVEENAQDLITSTVEELALETALNPSHVYARIIREAINNSIVLDELHFSDVLIALRNAGYRVDGKTGTLVRE